eukprot:GEMP01023554.1.p1 GENE.GEMP01023554.1~~GEMP01023554.1.p1  ORF type:complete len:298 (+),score=22.12 GEMP01023554.1:100-894(+)
MDFVSQNVSTLMDLSVVMTDLMLTFSLISLLRQVQSATGVQGVSLMSVVATVFGRGLHSLAGGFFEIHYRTKVIPFEVCLGFDYLNAVLGVVVLFYILVTYRKIYDHTNDNFGGIFLAPCNMDTAPMRWFLFSMLVAVYTVSLILVNESSFDLVSIYASSCDAFGFVALLPQLWMFHKEKTVSFQLGNFVFFIICHRLFVIVFYTLYYTTFRLTSASLIKHVAFEFFNILIAADFVYFYIRAKLRGDRQINISEIDDRVTDMLK